MTPRAVLASMREDSMKLAAAAASGSGELLSQSPVQSSEIVAVGAPKLACQAPPLTLTQRWQVMAAFVACLATLVDICASVQSPLSPSPADTSI